MNVLGSWEGYTSSPLYLFNNGVWSNVQSESITCMNSSTSWTTNAKGNVIILESSLHNDGLIRLNTAINLSNYNYINVSFTSFNKSIGYVGVHSSAGISSISNLSSKINTSGSSGILKLNVQSLKGAYWIYIGAQGVDNYVISWNIYKIFLSSV